MNYIEQLNYFYDLLQGNHLSNNAQLLYHTLLMINNKCSWIEWFQRTNVSLCSLTGIGEKALINARNELKQINLIDFITSKKRGECTKYKICTVQNTVQEEVQTQYKGSTNAVQPPDINKLNINKTNKKESKKAISYDDILLQNVESEELRNELLEFIKMRKLIKAPLTDNALILAIKKLEKLAPNDVSKQIAIVQQSNMNSWKGLFELKESINVKASNNKNVPSKEEMEEFDRRMELKFENEGLM